MFKYFILFFASLYAINGYKLFIYSPKFGKSHVTFMGKIADILVKAGHDVVYLPVYDKNITVTGTKYARVIERPLDFEIPVSMADVQDKIWSTKEQGYTEMQRMVYILSTSHSTLCKHQLLDTELMDRLRQEKFDLALGETFDSCFFGVIEYIGIENHVTVFSNAFLDIAGSMIGIPSSNSFLPGMIGDVPPFSYTGRAKNLLFNLLSHSLMAKSFLQPIETVVQSIVRKDFSVKEAFGNSAFVLVNTDEHVDFNRPISHKVVYIGGFGQTNSKPLESKYDQIMNSSKRGVVLVSFGSVAQSYLMPKKMKQKFLDAFSQFPDITFLWKYENDEDNISKGYPNVITEKWLPQTDLLVHPKLLAFISHGGANSIAEATLSGVPIICIPLFADQPRNGLLVKYRKVGVNIHKLDVMEGKLVDALHQVLDDPSYRQNSKRISSLIQSKPMPADDRLIKYVEFAAKFGNDNNLDMHGRHLNFFEFYCLDIILPFLGLVFLVAYILFRLMKLVVRKVFALFSSKKIKTA